MLDCRATVVHCHSTESPVILLHASSPARKLLTSLKGHRTCTAEFVLFWSIESRQLLFIFICFDCFCCGFISLETVSWFKYSHLLFWRFQMPDGYDSPHWEVSRHNLWFIWTELCLFLFLCKHWADWCSHFPDTQYMISFKQMNAQNQLAPPFLSVMA